MKIRTTFLYFVLTFLFVQSTFSIQPPLWPQRFSQGMTVDFGDLVTTAKFWYDSTADASRHDFQNGNSKSGCGAVLPGNTPCSYLTVNKFLYFVYTQKNMCCKLCELDIIPRDWLKNFTYIGQRQINGQTFDVWDENLGDDNDVIYYSDKSYKAIPRRQQSQKRIFLDYWPISYNQNEFDKSIFNVPSTCTKFCYEHIESQQQRIELYKSMQKYNKNIKIPSQMLKRENLAQQ